MKRRPSELDAFLTVWFAFLRAAPKVIRVNGFGGISFSVLLKEGLQRVRECVEFCSIPGALSIFSRLVFTFSLPCEIFLLS